MVPVSKLYLAWGALLLISTAAAITVRAEHLRNSQSFPSPVAGFDCSSIHIQTTLGSAPIFDSFAKPGAVFSISHDFDSSGFAGAAKGSEGFQTERRREDRDRVRLPFSVVAIPEPSTMVLLGSGLLALGAMVRRRLLGN